MQRPLLEVADIVRAVGKKFVGNSRKWIAGKHLKVLRAIVRCRTADLGYHLDECTNTECGYSGYSYNSCCDRHCPKCQANARVRWIQRRKKELLPVSYAHVVFTVPRLLAQLALQNKKLIYTMLLRLSVQTLIEVARNPEFLGAEIGFFSVLHTWTQKLDHHPHVHCVVPAGGLSFDHKRWIAADPRYRFFLPKWALRKTFRGKVKDALRKAFAEKGLSFTASCSTYPIQRFLTLSFAISIATTGSSIASAHSEVRNKVIVAYIKDLADVRMVQRSNGSGFLFESLAVLLLDLLDRHNSAETGITGLPHLSHTAGAYGFKDFVWAEPFPDHANISPENTSHSKLD